MRKNFISPCIPYHYRLYNGTAWKDLSLLLIKYDIDITYVSRVRLLVRLMPISLIRASKFGDCHRMFTFFQPIDKEYNSNVEHFLFPAYGSSQSARCAPNFIESSFEFHFTLRWIVSCHLDWLFLDTFLQPLLFIPSSSHRILSTSAPFRSSPVLCFLSKPLNDQINATQFWFIDQIFGRQQQHNQSDRHGTTK